jgi:hypothetical protein
MIAIAASTLSSSTAVRKVTLPVLRNPPVEAVLVTEKPSLVSAVCTAELSSLFTIAVMSFTILPQNVKSYIGSSKPMEKV